MVRRATAALVVTTMAAAAVLLQINGRTAADAHRILAYEPSVGHSHWNVMSAVLESLVAAGHEVVCLTVHPATELLAAHPNYTHVDMAAGLAVDDDDDDGGGDSARYYRTARDLEYAQLMSLFRSNAFLVRSVTDRMRRMCRLLFERTRDMPPARFDAVVMESLHSECDAALPRLLDAPAAYVVPCPPVNWMPAATGAPYSPSYMGALLADSPTPVTFRDRLANTLVHVHTELVRWYHDRGAAAATATATATATPLPSTRPPRGAVVLINTHHSIEPARPAGPNVVEIGGIHLRPAEPLPRDLAKVLDDSNEFGVIVFSFGSLLALNSLPGHMLDALKFVFGQLPQTVIWKYENDHMPDKPDNVVLCKWLPQRAILQHRNVKMFISHGGMSGMYEAVDGGVPILGMPLFFDQPRNIQNLVNLGMALSLNIEEMTIATLSEAINRLLEDRSFSENAKRVASLFKDRAISPADSAVYWIEYLIRHGSEANITPSSADTSWISHFLMDQLLVVLSVSALALWCCTRAFSCRTSNKTLGK